MKEEILQKVGLSKNEAKVYCTLLKEGSSSATEIMKTCHLHRSNVYDALEGLKVKGLAGYILIGKTKHFKASNPSNLMEMLKRRKRQLAEVIPNIKAKNKEVSSKTNFKILKGYKDLKKIKTNSLSLKKEVIAFGVPPEVPENLKSWLTRHHKERIKNKVPTKIIFNEGAEERAKKVNDLKLAEAKYFPKEFNAPVTTEVCGKEVIIIHWIKEPLIIHLECSEVANAYKRYFKLLWSIANGFSQDN